jgi:hypothetical protein
MATYWPARRGSDPGRTAITFRAGTLACAQHPLSHGARDEELRRHRGRAGHGGHGHRRLRHQRAQRRVPQIDARVDHRRRARERARRGDARQAGRVHPQHHHPAGSLLARDAHLARRPAVHRGRTRGERAGGAAAHGDGEVRRVDRRAVHREPRARGRGASHERQVLVVRPALARRPQAEALRLAGDERRAPQVRLGARLAPRHRVVGEGVQAAHQVAGRDRGRGGTRRVLERQRPDLGHRRPGGGRAGRLHARGAARGGAGVLAHAVHPLGVGRGQRTGGGEQGARRARGERKMTNGSGHDGTG